MPARSSVAGAERSGLAPRASTFKVQAPPLPACAVKAIIAPSMCASVSNTWKEESVYAVPLPAVAIAPATSSRYFEAAAIMARAESLTVEGACPSAQLIEPSAVALLAAVRDHFQKLIVGPQNKGPARRGRRRMHGCDEVESSFPLGRVLINRPACPPSGKPDI